MSNYREVLVEFMSSKGKWMQEYLNIDSTLYFTDEDKKEILSWDESEAKDIWLKIKKNINKNKCSGLRYEFCPFCYASGYKHNEKNPGAENSACLHCSYGRRHGICTSREPGVSQYQQILKIFKENRVNIYKTLSCDHYKRQVERLESSIN
jgi:Zn ribbon nucleic-acid-binding protein